jgi:GTP-binding protein EngB required for normal cell division
LSGTREGNRNRAVHTSCGRDGHGRWRQVRGVERLPVHRLTEQPVGDAPPPATLNREQGGRVASTLAYVEQLLRDIERLARLRASPFNREQQDLSDTEADLVAAFVETARERLLSSHDHLGLPRPKATLSARWSIMTALRFIDTSLSDLTLSTLRGYGAIDAASAAEVTAVAATLRGLVARGLDLLQPRDGEQLRERLTAIRGPLGEILRRAEALSTERGLVEVRPLIAAAAERARASTIDVGIFGRVSSGKSSFVNALVGVPLLPVGATPVTAVPLRVVHGPAEIRIFFLDGREEVVEPDRLAEFATETGNRDNARGVRSILIHTPHLPEGLALLDTPGVGSMSQGGPAQAFAWLPRCDLGLVLVAAGTPVGRDELALVMGLTRAGIAVEVLLSKSDLVSTSERQSAIDYVRSEIGRSGHTPALVVRPISVEASARDLLERWRNEELAPLVAARQRVAEISLARRVRALLGALNVALQRRPALERSTIDVQRARLEAKQRIEAIVDELEDSSEAQVEHAALAAARAWKEGSDARAAVRHALLEAPSRALSQARALADSVLPREDADRTEDVGSRIPPLFDPPLLDTLPIDSAPGAMDHLFAVSAARRHLAPIARPLTESYGTYANRLRAWSLARLEENAERSTASADADGSAPIIPELRPLAELVARHFGETSA